MSAAALSLHGHVAEVDQLIGALEAMEFDMDPRDVEYLEHEIREAIAGTREKIDRTAYVLASFEAAEEAAAKEIARLDLRKERIAKRRERLEGYVIGVLAGANLKRFEGNTSTLTAKPNPVAVIVDPSAEVPAEYMRTPEPKPPEAKPDKKAIKAALDRGEFVAGCRLQQTIRLVRS